MKRGMTSRVLTAAVAAVLLTVSAACGGSSGTADSGPTKITLWIQTGGWTDTDQAFVKQFNEKNTDVQIDYVSVPSDSIVSNLQLALRTGTGPDMWFGPSAAEVVPQGWAANVGDLLDDASKAAYAPYLEGKYDYIYDGQVMGLPSATVTVRLVYNKTLFKAAGLDPENPPKTYSEVQAAADAITASANGAAWGYALPMAMDGALINYVEPGVTGGNPDLTNYGGFNVKTGKFDMLAYEPAIALFRGLIASGAMYPGVGTLERDAMRAAFAAGKLGMYIGNSLEVGVMNNQLKTTVDWGAAPVPVPDGETLVNGTAFTGSVVFANSKTENKQALAKVYNAWMSPDRVGPLRKAGIIFPTSLTARADTQYDPADIHGYHDFEPGDIDANPAPSPGTLLTVPGASYTQVVNSLILDDADTNAALSDAAGRYDEAYAKALADGTMKQSDYQ